MNQAVVTLSDLDSERFGVTIARANRVTVTNLEEVMTFCEREHVDMLVARCPAHDLEAVQAMLDHGFRFMDGEVHYRGQVTSGQLAEEANRVVRPMRSDERPIVVDIAATSFSGFMSHYHADSRLDRSQSDAVYRSWADRCCSGDAADVVVVADQGGEIVGFSAFRKVGDSEGQLVLGAVSPLATGRGLYGQMTVAGARWCRDQGLETLLAITQFGNVPSQRTWAKLGMRPTGSAYTFHHWFGS